MYRDPPAETSPWYSSPCLAHSHQMLHPPGLNTTTYKSAWPPHHHPPPGHSKPWSRRPPDLRRRQLLWLSLAVCWAVHQVSRTTAWPWDRSSSDEEACWHIW